MHPMWIIDLIKTPAANILGIAAMVAAIFVSGCIHGEGNIRANWNEEKVKTSAAVATQAVAVADLSHKSQTINSEVSNYVQARSSDLSARIGGMRQPKSGNSPLPGVSGRPAGVASGVPGCVPIEQYNDLAWEAGNTAVMVDGWQLWYRQQREAYENWQRGQND